ncbi:MAG: zinc metallopeptidase, partial [Candidatus Obscuribacterales bacterium]|nr:zinc metallopeptidase [Steroidobacteraceae bacterium]
MRWRGREQSGNVSDRRGMSVGRMGGIGGVGALVVAVVAMLFGQDPAVVLDALNTPATTESNEPYQESASEAETRQVISVVLKDTERTWGEIFAKNNRQYEEPRLVLFTQAVQSACGTAQSAVGPFYCPSDKQVYIDLSFYDDLKNRFGAPGDFAQAYVIAHEVGHHVQNLLGTSARVQAAKQSSSEKEANALSVRLELQADCYAGIWANHANQSRQLLETGDVEEGLAAAAAIGDDRLQKQSRGFVAPESFTHGSSAQRVSWFRRGLESGSVAACDTFA